MQNWELFYNLLSSFLSNALLNNFSWLKNSFFLVFYHYLIDFSFENYSCLVSSSCSGNTCKFRNSFKVIIIFKAVSHIVSNCRGTFALRDFLIKLFSRFFVEDYFNLAEISILSASTAFGMISNSSPSLGFADDISMNPQTKEAKPSIFGVIEKIVETLDE